MLLCDTYMCVCACAWTFVNICIRFYVEQFYKCYFFIVSSLFLSSLIFYKLTCQYYVV
jgi:hypothetical protein